MIVYWSGASRASQWTFRCATVMIPFRTESDHSRMNFECLSWWTWWNGKDLVLKNVGRTALVKVSSSCRYTKKCRFASVYCQHAGTFLTLCLAKCTFHKSQATLRQTNIPLSPTVARFPPTKYGRFLSISSSMLTRLRPPTPTVYCTYIIKHRGPKTCYFGKNRRIVIWFTVYCLI